ncbi:MAG: type I methionyl aminopeptidase [Phycisphaerales bacterium]|nr:type I methionyl aminopeptidase [Phycisphaerales bacterium]
MPSAKDIACATAAAECVCKTHEALAAFLRHGQTLAQIDTFVAATLAKLDCKSCFLGYKARGHPPFPSHACLSINECVVHGTHDMNSAPIVEGDLVSIDIGVRHQGWIGDAAWTYLVKSGDPVSMSLLQCGRESLRLGVDAMQPGRPLIDWARVVQGHVETTCGFGLVRGLGGHGYGRTLHAEPFVSNVVPTYPGEWSDAWKVFRPGMLIAVEPMIAVSTTEIVSHGTAWPIFTGDGSRSVHFEADVLITESGPVNLTQSLFNLPDFVG